MNKATEAEVLGIIQKALKLKDKKVTLESLMGNIEEWDSLGHLSILVSLDQFFQGRISPLKELVNANSVRKILDILKKNDLI